MSNEILKVSDGSQKWKFVVYGLAIFGAGAWIYFILMPWMEQVTKYLSIIASQTT